MSLKRWSKIWILLGLAGLQMSAASCASLSVLRPAGIPPPIPETAMALPISSPTSTATGTPPPTNPPVSPSPVPSQTPTTTRPTATQPPTLTNTPTADPCWSQDGQMVILEPPEAPADFRVYLPPCYQEQTWRYYPVLYLIHGQGFTDDQWDRLGADEAANQLILSGETQPFLIVMPRDRIVVRPSRSTFEKEFVEELLPWVDSHYRTIPDRKFRAIGGLSRGASWAIHIGLIHWDMFGAIGGHSPLVFWEDVRDVRGWLAAIPADEQPRIYLDIGEQDFDAIMTSAAWFEQLLTEKEIPHEWYLNDGGHTEEYWGGHVEQYMRWYTRGWK